MSACSTKQTKLTYEAKITFSKLGASQSLRTEAKLNFSDSFRTVWSRSLTHLIDKWVPVCAAMPAATKEKEYIKEYKKEFWNVVPNNNTVDVLWWWWDHITSCLFYSLSGWDWSRLPIPHVTDSSNLADLAAFLFFNRQKYLSAENKCNPLKLVKLKLVISSEKKKNSKKIQISLELYMIWHSFYIVFLWTYERPLTISVDLFSICSSTEHKAQVLRGHQAPRQKTELGENILGF